ncbi:MAG: carboxypeptidase-like regulatory domain-containing protein [Terrimicrobiaceae bacterium]
MKSSNSRYWYIALLLAAAVATFLLWKPKHKAESTLQASPTPSPKLVNPPSPPPTPAPLVSGTTPKVDPVYEAINAEREQNVRDMANTPIDFFGKVVDEEGNPIEGASTFYIVGTFSFEGSPTLEGSKTDGAGLFSITEKRGPTLSVWVQHAGYYNTGTAKQRFEYARKDHAPGKGPPLPPRSSNDPTVFVLKKKGIAEPLVHHQRIKTKLPMNATPVTINARLGQAGGGGNEVISIAMKSNGDRLPLNTFQPFDWSVTIEAPGGGIVERSDALNFEAPVDGYVPQQTINMPASLPKDVWKSDIQRDYFVKFGSGNYGRVRLNISGDKGRSIAEVFLNPASGSRNLEFDSTKAVPNP